MICGKFADQCACPECAVCGHQGDPRCINRHMPWQRWFEHGAYLEDSKAIVALEICTVEEPWFICGVYGQITLGALQEIQAQIAPGEHDIVVPDDAAVIFTEWYWVEGETQYGTGYGDVLQIPGYWDVRGAPHVVRSLEKEEKGN